MEQNVLDGMYEQLGISKEVLDYAADIEKSLKERFEDRPDCRIQPVKGLKRNAG